MTRLGPPLPLFAPMSTEVTSQQCERSQGEGMKNRDRKRQSAESPPVHSTHGSERLARIAIGISALSLLLALVQTGTSWVEHGRSTEAQERTRQLQAFVLGRRATIFESAAIYYNAMLAHVGLPDSARAKERTQQELNATLTGNDMANAAGPLGLNLSPREDLWMLESRISGQLRDLYSPRVYAAYRLGRLLGGYDERAYLVVNRSLAQVRFQTCTELADNASRREWSETVDSLLKTIGMRPAIAWNDSGTAWVWCADGREALERSSDELAVLARQRRASPTRDLGRGAWEFAYLVTWEPGVWGPRSVPWLWVSTFGASTSYGFEGLVGRLGPDWRPELGH